MRSTVLIIDDNKGDNKLLQELLHETKMDFNILLAENGEDGMRMIQSNAPQLVFLDTVFPGSDGFKICRDIKSSGTKNMHVIMMTGKTGAVNEELAKDSGADGYCIKSPESILKALIQFHAKAGITSESKPTKILLFEDNPGDVRLMDEALQSSGLNFEFFNYDNAEDIAKIVVKVQPDVIFMDVLLPGMPGGDAVRILRSSPNFKNVPVVFLTGVWTKNDEKDPSRGIKIEGQLYPTLAKPIDPGKLKIIVELCLKK